MLNNKTIAVVIPVYNEENHIINVLDTLPDFVDRIVIINDCSTDNTENIVKNYFNSPANNQSKTNISKDYDAERPNKKINSISEIKDIVSQNSYFTTHTSDIKTERILLLSHSSNLGKGAGIKTGYIFCKHLGIDCVATMDGDGQMNPFELESICNPVVFEEVDYVKGNRLIHQNAWHIIPKVRIIGNIILSILTKPCSGYWKISDTQTGFTAISKKALNILPVDSIYSFYGYPNDVLVKLNICNCTIREVATKPIYHADAKSKMKIHQVIPKISWLLLKSFFIRLWIKYLFKSFHALFLVYNLALILGCYSFFLSIKIAHLEYANIIDTTVLPLFLFSSISSLGLFIIAVWVDIRDNNKLYK